MSKHHQRIKFSITLSILLFLYLLSVGGPVFASDEEAPKILAINWNVFPYQVINFAILFILLKMILMGPMEGILKTRAQNIANEIDQAAQKNLEAEKIRGDYESRIGKVDEECHQLMQKAIRESEEAKGHILDEARKEAEKVSAKAQRDIALSREKAEKSLRNEVTNLTILLTSKLLGTQVKEAEQKSLVDSFLKELA